MNRETLVKYLGIHVESELYWKLNDKLTFAPWCLLFEQTPEQTICIRLCASFLDKYAEENERRLI